jgi:hypothetical protein
MKKGDVVIFKKEWNNMTYNKKYIILEPGINQFKHGFFNVFDDNGSIMTIHKNNVKFLSEYREEIIDSILK